MSVNFPKLCEAINETFRNTPYWVLIKFGFGTLMSNKVLKDLDLSQCPDFDIFKLEQIRKRCNGAISAQYIKSMMMLTMWAKNDVIKVNENQRSVWAKLLALHHSKEIVSQKEMDFVTHIFNGGEFQIFGSIQTYAGNDPLAMLVYQAKKKGQGVEVSKFEDVHSQWVYDTHTVGPRDLKISRKEYKEFMKPFDLGVKSTFELKEDTDALIYIQALLPKNIQDQYCLNFDTPIEIVLPEQEPNVWKPLIRFPNQRGRTSRYYYDNAKLGLLKMAEQFTHILACNMKNQEIRNCFLRDATDLLTPSLDYGCPSTQNKQLALGSVGFVTNTLMLVQAFTKLLSYKGVFGKPVNTAYPDRVKATEAFFAKGIVVFHQHQMKDIRVGPGAAMLGLCLVGIANQELYFLTLSILVDKVKKFLNRCSLQNRVPTKVYITTSHELETEEF
ncbi:MAG: hypothetical protein L7S42_07930 [Flavobacteriaceae bacterium]|nr:hypothetical protein [Flavobacteriaceae bacterium]